MLQCETLTAGYAGVPVVRDLDLFVRKGEVVALLGPNGAGKTTAVLTLTGILGAISGHAKVDGEPVKSGRPHKIARRGVAFVPDDRSLFFGLTALENLQLGPGGSSSATIDMVMDYFPSLRGRLKTRAGLLSGGEQQMLAVGRAIAGRPKALIVDELSLGLAPVIVQKILPVIRRIADELDTAVLIVEQHVDLALGIADRAYVLNHGVVVTQGSGAELLNNRHLLASSYLGGNA